MTCKAGNNGYRWALSALAVLLLVLTGASSATAAVADREADPVVLTGAQTPALIGIAPDQVVAFSWNGAWKQIPVQVDERKIADYGVIRQISSARFQGEAYADPNTYTGADGVPQMTTGSSSVPVSGTTGDANLDLDDEIAMMSKDAGSSAAGKPDPAGVDGTSRTPVRIKDPLDPATLSYLYLYRTTTGLDPAAGVDYVSYQLEYTPALVPDYFDGYDFGGIDDNAVYPPANPEDSSVETALYSQTFPGKWLVEGLKVTAGTASGVDILDGDKSMIGQSTCGRNELTFSRGGGGVIAAIDGPVRAIRSYIGANSGTYTQRDQIYYEGRVDQHTYLRVHQGITDFILAMDYSPEAKGMTYRNSLNPGGVRIDGTADTVTEGRLAWEQVTGGQGSVTHVGRIVSDVPNLTFGSYYQDATNPPADNDAIVCSGDASAYGASGPRIKMAGAGFNTDPTLPPTSPSTVVNNFTGHRYTYIDGPEEPKETAILRSQQVDSPLVLVTGAATDPTGPVPDPEPDSPGKPGRSNWVGLKVSVKPTRVKARIGHYKVFRVKVRNVGDLPGKRLRVCPRANDRLVRTSKCKRIKKLRPGKSARFRFRATLRPSAARKRKVRVRFRAKARNSKTRGSSSMMVPRGR